MFSNEDAARDFLGDLPMGYWETEAPVDFDTTTRHRVLLERLMGRIAELTDVHLRDCEVWVEGVLWRYRRVDAKTFGG